PAEYADHATLLVLLAAIALKALHEAGRKANSAQYRKRVHESVVRDLSAHAASCAEANSGGGVSPLSQAKILLSSAQRRRYSTAITSRRCARHSSTYSVRSEVNRMLW